MDEHARTLLARAVDPAQYDAQAVTWADAADDAPRETQLWCALERLAPTWRGKRVLDVGCGTGWLIDRVAVSGAAYVEGIDPSRRNTATAQGRGRNVSCLTLETFRPETPFDVVLMVLVLPHIADPVRAFEQVTGVLTPEGELQVVIQRDVGAGPWERERVELPAAARVLFLGGHPRGPIADILRPVDVYIDAAAKASLRLVERLCDTELPWLEVLRFRRGG